MDGPEEMPMNPKQEQVVKLSVFCPTGSDRHQHFDDFAGDVNDKIHPPINYHAYTACIGGVFHHDISTLDKDETVLLLLGNRLGLHLRLLRKMKSSGWTVLVAFKETGFQQIVSRMSCPRQIKRVREIFFLADGCISPTRALVSIYKSLTIAPVVFIPTPYPVDDPRWDFSVPLDQRKGIFAGTREFFNHTRNHLFSLFLLKKISDLTGEPVTVINTDGFRGSRLLKSLGFREGSLREIRGKLPYSSYLREMTKHKFVFQLDQSTVPGQVAGDALLCGMPCVGGNGEIESLVFPELTAAPGDSERIMDIAVKLCEDVAILRHYIEDSRKRALEKVSFSVIAYQLKSFLASLKNVA
ncbi:MAG: hypothetical protein ABFD82_18240 [Syntrophaceae bacterium]